MRRLNIFAILACLFIPFSLFSQGIEGIISDETGAPLPGATVLIVGDSKGAFSDLDGKYFLQLDPGEYSVKYSFIGYKDQIKKVTVNQGNTKVDVKMAVDAVMMDDIVVVGYGVQRKREVTGSIAKVDGKKLTEMPVPSFEAALQGQAAGVQVSQGSGIAGSGSIIRVRGVASVSAGGDPLYVVDGIPITQDYFLGGNSGALNNNPLASLNPNDIESVDILKDAAATGIYGSRGANGVILITTKRGAKGLKFDFSSSIGLSTAASLPNMLNTDQYLQLRQEAWENDGGTGHVWLPNFSSKFDDAATRQLAFERAQETDTDWVGETIGTGMKQAYSFGVRSGGEKYSLYAGLSYSDNESFLIGNSYQRTSARVNFDYTINKWVKAMVSTSFSRGINNRIDAAWSGGLGDAMSNALPYYPVTYQDDLYDADSNLVASAGDWFIWQDEFGGDKNPVAYRETKTWVNTEDRSINNLSFIISPNDKVDIKLSGGLDWMNLREDQFNPPLGFTSEFGSAWQNSDFVVNWNYTATADYRAIETDRHRLNILVGNEFQKTTAYGNGVNFEGVTGPIFEVDSLLEEARSVRTSNPPVIAAFDSYFARANYTLDDRYFAQVTARTDGSSRFGSNYAYGFFPSFSAGWIISEEQFMSDIENISFLKLRASYGKTGNANIPWDARYGLYETSSGITYNNNPIIFPTQLPNPNLKWEESRTIDASLQIGLWNDRITSEISVYRKYATDLLLNVNLPSNTGFSNYWDNVATALNRGIEFSIKSYNLSGEFNWTTEFNISKNYNELVDIGDYTPDAVSGGTNDSRVIVGSPIGSFYLVEFSHIDSENGLPVYIDLDGNETYDYDNSIRKYVGDGLPDFVGGLTNTFSYKNWDLTALATFSLGAKIFDSSSKRQLGVVTSWNMREEILDRWQQPGDQSTYAGLTLDETNYGLNAGFPWWNTSLFVYDASYLRLRNLAIGYNIPISEARKFKYDQLRVGFNVTNVFTITNFPGLDPEVVRDFENDQDRNMSPNVTYLTPPQERSYNLSLNISF